jgi:GT2 family glycosyltransferase
VTLRLAACAEPEVSVVIVSHGGWQFTARALDALMSHTDRPYEVVVVDNASADETPERLAELEGARVVLNEVNRGFGPGCNQGAELARGAYLVFLNTDAFVHEGWLEPMIRTLETQAWVGAVVPRYLHEDGGLQEAGALLAQDGTVVTYGDGDRPDRLRYRFRRVVDYGGAACMLVRRSEFAALGGFDPVYAPAYYEDVDLCFRLAGSGRATVYEPRAVVTHVRHASGGLQRAVAHSEVNRASFVDRWREQLRGRPATLVGAGEPALVAARDAPASARVLVVDPAATAAGGGAAARLVASLAGGRPRARIAWLTGSLDDERFDPQPWLDLGVELVDEPPARWLTDRALSFDLAFEGAEIPAELRASLRATQPQARFAAVADAPGPGRGLDRLLALAGIGPAHAAP